MKRFRYVAKSQAGLIEHGQLAGETFESVRRDLGDRGLSVVSLKPLTSLDWSRLRLPSWQVRAVRSADIELTLQQLAVMLRSGLEISAALRELGKHSPNRQQRRLCVGLADAVERGDALSIALEDADCIPTVVVQLARVGEETGELATTLQRASEYLESRRQAFGNLVASLAYPAFVAVAACAVAAYLVGSAIPKLATFLHAMGRKMPAMTQSLLDVSAGLRTHGPAVGVLALSLLVGFVLVYLWPRGRLAVDRMLLRLPGIGSIIRMAETHQLASSLALLLQSGVFLPEALRVSSTLHRNRFLANVVRTTPDRLSAGEELASCLRGCGFEEMLPSMIAVGEKTGNLEQTLEHVARFYKLQVARKLDRFGKLIEPVMIVAVGGLVGYVYTAFFVALMSAGGKF